MPETRTEGFQLEGFWDPPGLGSAEILSFDNRERLYRSLKGLGSSWLVSAGTVQPWLVSPANWLPFRGSVFAFL